MGSGIEVFFIFFFVPRASLASSFPARAEENGIRNGTEQVGVRFPYVQTCIIHVYIEKSASAANQVDAILNLTRHRFSRTH